MPPKIIALTRRLISIRSEPENRRALDEILDLALSKLGGFTIEHFERNGVKSALVYRAARRPKRFKVILNGHLDVIPAKEHQYRAKIRGGRLYGAGAMDMKANVACLIMSFLETADKLDYPLGLQLVTDEETGGFNGTKYQIERGVRADFALAGETTNFNIVNRAKGIMWAKVSCRGRTAHGAYPWKGENAIWSMNRFLNSLAVEFPLPQRQQWRTTVNLSRVETTNQTFNKIPDDCAAWLDIRYVPEDAAKVAGRLKALLPRAFKLQIVAREPAMCVDQRNPFLRTLRRVTARHTRKRPVIYGAQGSSDARHFAQAGCAGVEFGPIGGGIGTDAEWVDIKSLDRYCRILQAFLLELRP